MYPGKWTCPNCDLVWVITKHKLPMRDKDSLECKCGEEILSWNGAVMYNARIVKMEE